MVVYLAEFVVDHYIGIIIDSLKNIPLRITNMSNDSYMLLVKNVRQLGNKVRNGEMLKHCIE